MKKYYQEWNGKEYAVRALQVDEKFGAGSEVLVADRALWEAMESDYYDNNSPQHNKAVSIDDTIVYYFEGDYINSDPSDDDIIHDLFY